MLPREIGFVLDEGEAHDFEFLDGLLSGHFVESFDGDSVILSAVFEEVDFSAGFEGVVDGFQHFGGVREFVIGIDEECGVDGVRGELDRIDGAEVGLDIGDLTGFGFFFEVIEHFLLDIDGDNFALWNKRGDTEAVVSGASADIGDDGVGCEIEESDGLGGGLFFFAVAAFQPADAGMSHDLGYFPSHENFADAIG